MSLFEPASSHNMVECRERKGREGERERERDRVCELSGWGGVREGRMDVLMVDLTRRLGVGI